MGNAISSVIASVALLFAPESPEENKPCVDSCKVSEEGRQIIRTFEGYSPFIYKDVAGYPTIGFGHLIKPGEKFKEPLMTDAAEKLLQADLAPMERSINRMVSIPTRQHQFDAVGSFVFNLGPGAFQKSTLLKRMNASRHDDATKEFLKWNKAGKPPRPVTGLTARRKAESKLYSGQ